MRKACWLLLIVVSGFSFAQDRSTDLIRLNQLGFYPSGNKEAAVLTDKKTEFYILSTANSKKIFTGVLDSPIASAFSDINVSIANFSAVTTPGNYIMVVPGVGTSYPFQIKKEVHRELAKASIKAFYFQRLSMPLESAFAGPWARATGKPDTKVLIHASAASTMRPQGTIINSSRGWLDAGDYNKYIVNSGITMGTLLSLYEDFPEFMNNLPLEIPERTNKIPDVLDEVLWNLRWMLTMQDPNDGGVYHKCTHEKFDGMVMPDATTWPRYVVQKGTAAALDFAAVMAQAARVYKKFNEQLPGLADSCLIASVRAWEWAQENPNVVYDQEKINKTFTPPITTGAYGDKNFSDEFSWAATELFITTGNSEYLPVISKLTDAAMPLPSWAQVKLLGYYSLLRFDNELPESLKATLNILKIQMTTMADALIAGVSQRAYHVVMGQSAKDFVWGSNSVAANQGIALVQAYKITKDKKYLLYALSNLDYMLGRNATGYSFVTGFGSKSPMHPHHRPSVADGVTNPVPGFLVGGPNPGKQDKCVYPSSVADEAYVDSVCSYASNEVAINWNAALAYLTCAMEALSNR
jgi:endoglucanase